jgi:nucleoid-associated protein YgaU
LTVNDEAQPLVTLPAAKQIDRQKLAPAPQPFPTTPASADSAPVYPQTPMNANYLQSPTPAVGAKQATAWSPIGDSFNNVSAEAPAPLITPLPPTGVNRSVVQYSSAAPPPALRMHRIIDGDSLPKLAARYLRDPRRSEEIFALNREVLENPDLLPIGAELKIPAVRASDRGE